MNPRQPDPHAPADSDSRLQRRVAAAPTRYRACTVDPRPARAVHCPDLNACLVNESRPAGAAPVHCNAVHFGYAIPVSVRPLDSDPELAELLLEPGPELSPGAVAYLLGHHPQLRSDPPGPGMAAAARRGGPRPKFAPEPEEDIAAIAKQISDHAEAIYQTWKSRGLAPTEILSCHGSATAADRFGPALTPSQRAQSPARAPSPVAELLAKAPSLDANKLERLVSSFVSEDKARLAAQRQSQGQTQPQAKPLPSSIQFALDKFEKQAAPGPKPSLKPEPLTPKPTPHHSRTPSVLAPGRFPVAGDTIETILPPDINPIKPQPQSSSGLTTWPLKVKPSAPSAPPAATPAASPSDENKFATLPSNNNKPASVNNNNNSSTANNNSKNSAYLEEVAREEERLINALKTGIIIAEEPKPAPKPAAVPAPPTDAQPLDKAALSSLSAVDFAKARYRSAQQNPLTQQRLQDARQLRPASPAHRGPQEVVAVARNRFQLGPRDAKGKSVAAPHPPEPKPQLARPGAAAAEGKGVNPVRPFLTRGSVAERVLIFEKCPSEWRVEKQPRHRAAAAAAAARGGQEAAAKAQTHSRAKDSGGSSSRQPPAPLPPGTTLQRHVRANRNLHIPRFYFPNGKPGPEQQLEQALGKIGAAFRSLAGQQATREQFHLITKAADCPLYWKVPLFVAAGGEKLGYVEANSFAEFWKTMCGTCHDAAARLFYILSRGQGRGLSSEDFIPLVQDVVETHPGLTFLKEATEFHSRYVLTVITRIFYCVNRSWSGRISLPELRRSDLPRVLRLLEEEEDINQVTAYFSYEHFYVIYCKFWELDRDHDLYIDRHDLARHSDHALSTRMIERIFSGAVTRGAGGGGVGGRARDDRMSYTDFVWFLLSEEDKRHPTAIEYWFRCMDMDGDGYLSMYELEYFYEEQLQRMEAIGIETLPFEDCLCQMLDMIRPAQPGRVSLSDLKRCKMTPIFFDTFFNLEKYLDHEQRDPFASQRDHDTDGQELSDWDRFAADEYELLVAEEGGGEPAEDQDGEGSGEDVLSPNLDCLVSGDAALLLELEEEPGPAGAAGDWLGLGPGPGRLWADDLPAAATTAAGGDSDPGSDSADYAGDSDTECPV